MSLLLDALQRASKEKAATSLGAPNAQPPPAPSSPSIIPSAPKPALELSIAPLSEKTSPPAQAAEPASPLSLSLSLSLAPLAEPAVVAAPPAEPAPAISTPPVAAAPPEPAQPRPALREAPPSTAGTATQPAASPLPEPSASPAPPPLTTNTARDILSASASTGTPHRSTSSPATRKRLIALGISSGLVGLLSGSFFLGYWDALLPASHSGLIVPQTTPTTPTTPAVPAATATPDETANATPEAAPAQPNDHAASATPPAPPAPTLENTSVATAAAAARPVMPVAPARPAVPVRPAPSPAAAAPGKLRTPAHPAHAPSPAPLIAHRPAGPGTVEQGYTALTQGRLDEAAAAYRRALQGNPDERDALLGLAYVAQRQGHSDEARGFYQRVLRQDPNNATAKAALLALLGDSEPQKASTLARDLTEQNPQSAITFATLGSLMVREGRLAEAQQAFFKAVSLEPDSALYTYNLAVALDRLHKPEQAAHYYTRAVALADKLGGGIPRETALQRIGQLRPTASTSGNPPVSTP